jgi:hypothetical protein
MNYLELEILIIERLRAVLPNVHVLGNADVSGVKFNQQPVPAVHVILATDNPSDQVCKGREQRIQQKWYVTVAVRNTADLQRHTLARHELGLLIYRTLAGLQSWKPLTGNESGLPIYKELERVRATANPWSHEGFAYYPLLFQTEFVINLDWITL